MTDLQAGGQTKETARQLSTIEHPHETALILLAQVLGKPKTWVIAHPDAYLTPEQSKQLNSLVKRLCDGEPLPYLIGHQEFFGLDFRVTTDVLIPRPETELLVEIALQWLNTHPHTQQVLDVGTGSGCIPISLLMHADDLQMTAADVSPLALALAAENAAIHLVKERIRFIQSDLLDQVEGKFDLITGNLPYIPTGKLTDLNNLSYEPKLALDGGEDGLTLIRRLLDQAPGHHNRPALILLEIESTLGNSALQLAKSVFPSEEVSLLQDLAGLDRLIAIEVN